MIKEINMSEDIDKIKEAKIPTRRAKMLMVNPVDFMFLFTKGLKWRKNTSLVSGIPEDAELLTIAAEPVRGGIMLVVKSASYPEIPISQMPPIELVEIQTGVTGATKKKVVRKKRK